MLSMATPCEVCGIKSVANSLCAMHYKRWQRHGDIQHGRPENWGQASKHPLKDTWVWTKRIKEGRVASWDDFWAFVKDVGERPSKQHALRRYNPRLPWGPDNCYWGLQIPSEDKAKRQREWRAKNRLRAKGYELKRRLGITLDEYTKLAEKQGGVCIICGKKDDAFSLAVDHNEKTGKIRGLLCSLCNRGLGFFRDDPNLLSRAVDYLVKHGENMK